MTSRSSARSPRPIALALALAAGSLGAGCASAEPASNMRRNVPTDFARVVVMPKVHETAFIDPGAVVIGSVELGARVFIAPNAFLRGDEGARIRIGDDANVQDCAGCHGLETEVQQGGHWEMLPGRRFTADGKRLGKEEGVEGYSVWIGDRVSLAHQSQVHGPAWIGEDTFIGMQALVFNARVGRGCVIMPKALVMQVEVADGRFVPPGAILWKQAEADALPPAKGSGFEKLNAAVVHVNTSLAAGYLRAAHERKGESEAEPAAAPAPAPAPGH